MTILSMDSFSYMPVVGTPTAEDLGGEYRIHTIYFLVGGYPKGKIYTRATSIVNLIPKKALDFDQSTEKLVVGMSCRVEAAPVAAAPAALFAVHPAPFGALTSTVTISSSGGIVLHNSIPALCYRRQSASLKCIELHTVVQNTTNMTNKIFSQELPGLQEAEDNFFEAVYDFNANTIEVWVNDILLQTVPYTFTEAQKTTDFGLYPLAFSGRYSGEGDKVTAVCSGMYAATERLGPVDIVCVRPDEDIAASPGFGSGPFFQDLQVADSGFAGSHTSEDSILVSGTFEDTESEIVAVSVRNFVAAKEQSALEHDCEARPYLYLGGVSHYGDYTPLVSESSNDANAVFPTNPMTGVEWTPTDIDSLAFGIQFKSTSKFGGEV